ncbi:MAG: 3-deoxy-D-manno-octulosonic acid transferase [Burkholderiaceae bacterium]
MTARERGALIFYQMLWLGALPLAFIYLLWRSRRQPDYRRHLGERLGRYRVPSPEQAPIWLHLVSVGETRGAQALIRALAEARPGVPLLITHMTPTGRETSQALYPQATRVYLPYDHPWLVRRFLRHFRPRLAVIMETELWPTLIHEAAAAGVPTAIVNARLSERSLASGLRFRALIAPALRRLDRLLAQDAADAARLARLGRAADAVTGNLKFDIEPDQALQALGRGWRDRLGAAPVLMLASSRDGEEAALLAAWQEQAAGQGGSVRLCIVPRHPQRFDEVARAMAAVQTLRRRSGDWQGDEASMMLGDSMGEMAAYYAMADLVIMGGSLLPFGGQNLIEACAAGVPVIVGPHTRNFAQVSEMAIEAGAALRAADAGDALAHAFRLLADGTQLAAMRARAREFAGAHRGASERTLAALMTLLPAD